MWEFIIIIEALMYDTASFIHQITNMVPDVIYVYDLDLQQNVYINREITELLGYTPEQISLMGSNVLPQLMHPDDFQAQIEQLDEFSYLPDDQMIERYYRWYHANGDLRWLYIRTKIFARHMDNRPRQLLGVAQDVTERKHLEVTTLKNSQLELQLQKEHELNLIKSAMMQRISHEFRTPLAIIMSSSELLERYYERHTPEKRQQLFSRLREQVHHLTFILDDILQVVTTSLDHHDFFPMACNLTSFCNDCMETVLQRYPQAKIDFVCHYNQMYIRLDVYLVEQILVGVLLNAVKYSPLGNSVTFVVTVEKDYVTFQVRDEGLGIPAKDQPHIYEAFYRGSNLNEIGGLGLGLTIVKRAIELHQGHINIVSTENAGTTVTMRLPYT
jgi:PAS domain S-box-containing protein